MEEEIQEKLEDIYTFKINVEFKEFRVYDIYCILDKNKAFGFTFLYDTSATLETNINKIKNNIDRELIELFRK